MRPLDPPRTIPQTPRYVTVEAGGPHAPHVLRAPTFALARAVRAAVAAEQSQVQSATKTQAWLEEMSTGMAIMVGACWWHPELDFEAARPGLHAPVADWAVWGEEVVSELLDQRYTLTDLVELFGAASDVVSSTHAVLVQATERSDFSSGPAQSAGAGPESDSAPRAATA